MDNIALSAATKVNQEEIDNLSKPITRNEIESNFKNSLLTRAQNQTAHWRIVPNIPRRKHIDPSQILPKDWRGKNTPKDILWKHHHFDTKTKDTTKKENYRRIPLMNRDTKLLNNTLAKWIQQHMQKVTHHDQFEFISASQGWFSFWKSMGYTTSGWQ